MDIDISDYPTEILLEMARYEGGRTDIAVESEKILLKRWRVGYNLDFLIELMQSKKSGDRLRGAYYLGELGEAIKELEVPATQFADDPLSDCRRAFVGYMASSGYYDEAIASGLARCLVDLDLYVRVATIQWAVHTTDDRFQEFSRLVESGVDGLEPRFSNPLSNNFWKVAIRNRATRGLNIVCRIRAGHKIKEIREQFIEEDSFVLDNILFSQTRRERRDEWNKIRYS